MHEGHPRNPLQADATATLREANAGLMKRLREAEEQLKRAEEENREFASTCVRLQEENEGLNSLYVASYRLHATLHPEEVMAAIKEVLIELVGAEEFALLLLDERKKRLQRVAWEGSPERLPLEVMAGDGEIGRSVYVAEPVFLSPEGSPDGPLCAVPLRIGAEPVGVILIYKLLRQKTGFSASDVPLLQLLAAHAATALVSARLHSVTDRKLRTIAGFIHDGVTGPDSPGGRPARERLGLTGRIEDLSVPEIFQIVAFSRKTGRLRLDGHGVEGVIVFDEGRIVGARCPAEAAATDGRPDRPAIERSVRRLALLDEGDFEFKVLTAGGLAAVDVARLEIQDGLDTEGLLLDLFTQLDEQRREGPAVPEETMSPTGTVPASEPAAALAESPREVPAPAAVHLHAAPTPGALSVVVADDEPAVAHAITGALRSRGHRTLSAGGVEEAATAMRWLLGQGDSAVLVSDLAMPTSNGRGFLGGLEIAERLHKKSPDTPILLMAGTLPPIVRDRVHKLGVRHILPKPELSKLDEREYQSDLAQLAGLVADRVDEISRVRVRAAASRRPKVMGHDGPADACRALLDHAAKVLDRAVLFLVRERDAWGIGAAGLDGPRDAGDALARQLLVPCRGGGPMSEVVAGSRTLVADARAVWAGLRRGRWDSCPGVAVLIPIVVGHEVLLVLYGDNARRGYAVGPSPSLEIAAVETGLLLQNRHLRRRLEALEPNPSPAR